MTAKKRTTRKTSVGSSMIERLESLWSRLPESCPMKKMGQDNFVDFWERGDDTTVTKCDPYGKIIYAPILACFYVNKDEKKQEYVINELKECYSHLEWLIAHGDHLELNEFFRDWVKCHENANLPDRKIEMLHELSTLVLFMDSHDSIDWVRFCDDHAEKRIDSRNLTDSVIKTFKRYFKTIINGDQIGGEVSAYPKRTIKKACKIFQCKHLQSMSADKWKEFFITAELNGMIFPGSPGRPKANRKATKKAVV